MGGVSDWTGRKPKKKTDHGPPEARDLHRLQAGAALPHRYGVRSRALLKDELSLRTLCSVASGVFEFRKVDRVRENFFSATHTWIDLLSLLNISTQYRCDNGTVDVQL